MVKKWIIPYAIILNGMAALVIWALCIAFMNHGICPRTVIAFVMLIIAPRIFSTVYQVRKHCKKEEAKNEPVSTTD